MFIFVVFGKKYKIWSNNWHPNKGVQKISVFAYTYCTHTERCYMRYSAITCPYLPLPALTCLYLPLSAFTCLYLPLPAL